MSKDHQIRDELKMNRPLDDLTVGGPEFVCKECGSRCTESPTMDVEYGHRGWCTHSAGRISQQDSNKRAAQKQAIDRGDWGEA